MYYIYYKLYDIYIHMFYIYYFANKMRGAEVKIRTKKLEWLRSEGNGIAAEAVVDEDMREAQGYQVGED